MGEQNPTLIADHRDHFKAALEQASRAFEEARGSARLSDTRAAELADEFSEACTDLRRLFGTTLLLSEVLHPPRYDEPPYAGINRTTNTIFAHRRSYGDRLRYYAEKLREGTEPNVVATSLDVEALWTEDGNESPNSQL